MKVYYGLLMVTAILHNNICTILLEVIKIKHDFVPDNLSSNEKKNITNLGRIYAFHNNHVNNTNCWNIISY